MIKKVLVTGGYGNFGRLISTALSNRDDLELIITGRREPAANRFAQELTERGARCKTMAIAGDIHSRELLQILTRIKPALVIHTAGPFQRQDYHVATACIDAGSHYIDLADDRRFVCDFHTLTQHALSKGVIAVSGVSSVPGLSSVVIDHYLDEFVSLREIDFCIVPGSNVELGPATLEGILSTAGHLFQGWQKNRWQDLYGWMSPRRYDAGNELGRRWLANVNIPDLELFPQRYRGVGTVRFQAGHELTAVHHAMVLMGLLTRMKIINNWARYTVPLHKLGRLVRALGSDTGGMVIKMSGLNLSGQPQTITWRMIARHGVGPHIPTIPAIILANRILDNTLTQPGAFPCLGMFTLDEFMGAAGELGIHQQEERSVG